MREVSKRYESLIKEQKELTTYFKTHGIKNDDEIEEYADFFFREFEADPERQSYLKKMRESV